MPDLELKLEFTQTFRILGPDWLAWVAAPEFARNAKNAAVLVPFVARYGHRNYRFDWPGEIRGGTLKVLDLPDETREEVARAVGLDTLRERVREERLRIGGGNGRSNKPN